MQPRDYNQYFFTRQEYVLYGLQGIVLIGMISYLFYRSAIAFILMLPYFYFLFREKRELRIRQEKNKLRVQFKEMLTSVTAGLQAGYSIENSFREAYEDTVLIYSDQTMMAQELRIILNGLCNNSQAEELIANLAARSGVEEISEFASVFQIAKRSGGNLTGILQNCAEMIGDKIEVKQTIATVISAKQMESRIMSMIPFGIIAYISLTSPGFFQVLYHNVLGVVIMTGCLGVYYFAYRMAGRIVQIEV